MNEIEQMYKNAGIEKQKHAFLFQEPDGSKEYYPPFTAEKQLEVIKFVAKIEWIDNISSIVYRPLDNEWGIFADSLTELSSETPKIYGFPQKTFEEALAKLVNELWQDLTEDEKQKIREILK